MLKKPESEQNMKKIILLLVLFLVLCFGYSEDSLSEIPENQMDSLADTGGISEEEVSTPDMSNQIIDSSSAIPESGRFRIDVVEYKIKGITRQYPLRKAVPIATERVFQSRERLDAYLSDIKIQLNNQRVFQSAELHAELLETDTAGIFSLKLIISTVDTWNIIALPYPKFDSNTGFELKFKLKDYNFFGSMQELSGDLTYEFGNDNRSRLTATLDFAIPFEALGYEWQFKTDFTLLLPEDETPQYIIGTGVDVTIPFKFASLVLGVDHDIYINDREKKESPEIDRLYENDRLYFRDTFSARLPIYLYTHDYFGRVTWSPWASLTQNWYFTGLEETLLQGPLLTIGHALSAGRVDWKGNFRRGVTGSIANTYIFNLSKKDALTNSVLGSLSGYTVFTPWLGMNARIKAQHNFGAIVFDTIGQDLRGILNKRIKTDSGISFNLDIPARIMHVDFVEITGVKWTRFISFEMHASPFFDMALTHDLESKRYFDIRDGWYGGGMEVLVYPARMRSLYGRVSAGWDLTALYENGGKLSGRAERDNASIRELFIGIGLHY